MKIIIIGDGKVGYTVAKLLSSEGHDLTIVDRQLEALRRADEALDVRCVKGDGASIRILLEAGAREADLVIAVTDADEVNMVCCLIAKKLGAKQTVARIRNPVYSEESGLFRRELELDLIVNPEAAAAQEIAKILRFPHASYVDSFSRGRVEMVGFRVTEADGITGKPLAQLRGQIPGDVLICMAQRGDQVDIPHGDHVLQPGDSVYVMGEHKSLVNFFARIGRTDFAIREVMVVGGGRVAVYLAWKLSQTGVKIRIVERDLERCQHLAELLPDTLIIHGDGTEQDQLENENLRKMDAFVVLTGRDEENLLSALYAQQVGVPKVVAKIARMNYMSLAKDMGVDSTVSPKDITANRILRYVRGLANSEGSVVESLYKLLDGAAEAVEFTANSSTRLLDISLRQLKLKKGILICTIVRGDNIIIPRGEDQIREGDRVIVVAKSLYLKDLNDILED